MSKNNEQTKAAVAVNSTDLLGSCFEIHDRRREILWLLPDLSRDPVPPYHVGGVNGSKHSNDLLYLTRKGLVESIKCGGWSKPSRKYRRTKLGDEALKTHGNGYAKDS